jgi:hypothetical protein
MPTNNLYNIHTYDGLVSTDAQQLIWKYLEKQTWHVQWHKIPEIPSALKRYKPNEGKEWFSIQPSLPSCSTFHRCALGSDEASLKETHPVIWGLWKTINAALGNEYTLTGTPEGMSDRECVAPPTQDPNIAPGWRVYTNGTFGQTVTGVWGPHRDTPDTDDETSVTILYCMNQEWYPSWGGELVYFPEDPNGQASDSQQWNTEGKQNRGFNIGWPDQGRIVSPVPGRVIVYDGRCLHNTKPPTVSVHSMPYWKLAFRARRKTPWPD